MKVEAEQWISVDVEAPCMFVYVLGALKDPGPFPAVREVYKTPHGIYCPALHENVEIPHWAEMPEPPIKAVRSE